MFRKIKKNILFNMSKSFLGFCTIPQNSHYEKNLIFENEMLILIVRSHAIPSSSPNKRIGTRSMTSVHAEHQ